MTTAIGAGLDELVAALRVDMPGVHVTREPGRIAAPCVYVGLPRIEGRTLAGWIVEVPVYAVGSHPLDELEQNSLLALTERMNHALGHASAERRDVEVAENVTHPAYASTVRRLIGETT